MKHKETTKEFVKRKELQFEKDLKNKKAIGMKDIGRKGRFYFLREAWTFMPQYNLKNDKVFIIERLQRYKTEGVMIHKKNWRNGDIVYRMGYFIRGRIGRANGRWVWGQFCPLFPEKDLMKLINKAKKEGTIK